MSAVHIFTRDVAPPDAEVRAALIELANRWRDPTLCIAVVIEHDGMLGLALRGAITGMTMLIPKHYRLKLCDGLAPCANWVADQHARPPNRALDASELLTVYGHARQAVGL